MHSITLAELITKAGKLKASDIHLLAGHKPYIRGKEGSIQPYTDEEPLTTGGILKLLKPVLSVSQEIQLQKEGDIDLAMTAGSIRTRINAFRAENGLSVAIRLLKDRIPTMNELGLPMSVQSLINQSHGLILFTAPTGNGKSTSIASMLEAVNERQQKRVITIEDPIEYIYPEGSSLFSQRAVGRDCPDFFHGLRSALRENPDIILIGEMRDCDTILAAISAAETGHLVFSTLHSADAVEAIDRIMQYFPTGQQELVRSQFSNAFLGIIAQKLLPRRDKQGRIAAFEVVLATDATKAVIRSGKTNTLKSYMSTRDGMLQMEASVQALKSRLLV